MSEELVLDYNTYFSCRESWFITIKLPLAVGRACL